ncbi:MAG: glycosyltransferase family 39 protein [Actinomycetota bacterium]
MDPSTETARALPVSTSHDVRRRKTTLGVPPRVAVWVAILMVVGSLLCIALWGTTPRVQVDTSSYQGAAQRLSELDLDTLFYRSLGYPAILVLTGSEEQLTPILFVVQLAFHLCTVWVIIALAQRFELPHLGSIGLAFVLLSPPVIERVTFGLSETSCALFVALTAMFLVRWMERRKARDALLAGISIAIAAFMRPNFQFYGVLTAVAVLVWLWRKGHRREALRSAGLLILGSAVLIGGMTLFNTVRFGYPGFSPLTGWLLSTKTTLLIDHLSNDEPAKPFLIAARERALETNPRGGPMYALQAIDQLETDLHMDRATLSQYMLALNLRLIRHHPGEYSASVVTDAGRYILPTTGGTSADFGTRGFSLWFLLAHFGLLLAFFVQLVGVIGLHIARRLGASIAGPFSNNSAIQTWWIALSLVVYCAVTTITIVYTSPRHRVPTDPLILLLIFGGAYLLFVAFRQGHDSEPDGRQALHGSSMATHGQGA